MRYSVPVTIELGPFRLLQPVGRGGMGVVWRGEHIGTGTPVAVKVITRRASPDERTLIAFRNEVRAVAALNHPGIVWVADYGAVSEQASVASGRKLFAGNPYLVMELATGGTLSSVTRGMPWTQLKATLLCLLDALAHAHARGVIHRDLKPGNVLICSPADRRPGLKLTDFGIAHAREEIVSDSMSNHVIGTLHYMAPEQIRADWRDYGPWTDLYALGIIAYRLSSGILPFKGKRGASLMVAQLNHRHPPLHPIYPIPSGFEAWLDTMMRKDHWRRFQCAADAAIALSQLEAPEEVVLSTPAIPGLLDLIIDDDPTTLVLTEEQPCEEKPSVPTPRSANEWETIRAPLPSDWRVEKSVGEARNLHGAGLGLWGLRVHPLIGRERERDILWKALREMNEGRRARLVVVQGPRGCGKSSIIRWIVNRAVETGAASLLHCTYSADDEPREGLRRMLRRHFRVARLDEEERQQRVEDVCNGYGDTSLQQASAVARMLVPVDADATVGGDWHETARWLFARMASDRPLILWFDEAQFGVDALKLTRTILKSQHVSSSRILIVLGVGEEALARRPIEASFLRTLTQLPSAETLHVGPLPEADMRQLIEAELGLDASLAAEVVTQAAGSPRFAIQLVGSWVERGILRRGEAGFVLPKEISVPDSMGQVWTRRLAQIIEGLPALGIQLLERAAVLGQVVNDEEWQRACDDPDGRRAREHEPVVRPDHQQWREQVMERLFANNLAERRDEGFSFRHEEFRATLLNSAKSAGRLRTHHAAVAKMLARKKRGMPERLGIHLLAAGELDAAIEELFRGIRSRAVRIGPRPALELWHYTESAFRAAKLSGEDERWGRLWMIRAGLAIQRGHLRDASELAKKVIEGATENGWVGIREIAVFSLAAVAMFRDQPVLAQERFEEFEAMAISGAHALHRAASRHALSLLATKTGDHALARTQATACSEWLIAARASLAEVWSVLGGRALLRTHALVVFENLDRWRKIYACEGQLEGLAGCWMMLAKVLQKSGDRPRAEVALRSATELYSSVKSELASRSQVQLSMLLFTQQSYEDAEILAKKVLEASNSTTSERLRACSIVAGCASAEQRWPEVRSRMSQCAEWVRGGSNPERMVGWIFGQIGSQAQGAGEVSLALAAWRAARHQYELLGDHEKSHRLELILNKYSDAPS